MKGGEKGQFSRQSVPTTKYKHIFGCPRASFEEKMTRRHGGCGFLLCYGGGGGCLVNITATPTVF